MTYKVRHKGKPRGRLLPAGLMPLLVQFLFIIAALVTAIMLPRHAGKEDLAITVALSAAAVGGVLAALTVPCPGRPGQTGPLPRRIGCGDVPLSGQLRAGYLRPDRYLLQDHLSAAHPLNVRTVRCLEKQ